MLGADKKRLLREVTFLYESAGMNKRLGSVRWSEVRLVREVKSSGRTNRLVLDAMCRNCSWDKKEMESSRQCRKMQFWKLKYPRDEWWPKVVGRWRQRQSESERLVSEVRWVMVSRKWESIGHL